MEKTSRAAVVPLSAGWCDIGSWASLHDILPKDAQGNTAVGQVVIDACRDTHVSASGRLVAAIGLEGVVIVETADAVLVVAREHAESVKRVAELIEATRQRSQASEAVPKSLKP
jgi:mannose-1-phosphate guanylyltransferase